MYNNLRLIYITTGNREEAERIGRSLVEQRLAACVNIIDGMKSIYRWEGEVEEAQETILIAKTHYSKVKALTEQVKNMHSYDCPCVVSISLTEEEGNADYIRWLIQESKG